MGNKFEKPLLSYKNTLKKEKIKQQKPKDLGARRKETIWTTDLQDKSTTTVKIKETLDQLSKNNFKNFNFYLQQYKKSIHDPICLSKLEGADTTDTARLLTEHYGENDDVRVTIDILRNIKQRNLASQLENWMGQLEQRCLSKDVLKKEANQGDKLKNLLTCGGNSLDNYSRFVVVVNKSSPEQLQYLQFFNKLKPFCVLDFDPSSVAPGGLCHSYSESRVANKHTPLQYQGQTDSVIKSLNLYKQTSWVFCNGRNDLDSDLDKELDYKNWLRKTCRDVEQLVSFICSREVRLHGKCLIIFLLLSPVDTEKDPIVDTYKAFIKQTEEENIITISASRSTYEKWRELIQEKFDSDIDPRSIYELTLSEVNGTVMALGPFNQSSGRLLPSSDSSFVVLKQKDEDLLTALDILCLNQCENIYDENSPEFHDFRIKVEEEFYRGGNVKWWNFYFCDKDKDKPFVKRDKYKTVKRMIRSQLRDSKNMCVPINRFHYPGCGGSTLAMHLMWDLDVGHEFRCAVLKDNTLPKKVAIQVIKLMKLESKRPSPVFLLVDDLKETDNLQDLVSCIDEAAPNHKVIILNCVRTLIPNEQYKRHNPNQSQYINSDKTEDIVWGPKHIQSSLSKDIATPDGIAVASSTTVGNLGVIFDQDILTIIIFTVAFVALLCLLLALFITPHPASQTPPTKSLGLSEVSP